MKPNGQSTVQSRQLGLESVSTWPSKSKRWALIIGVDRYRDPQINALKGSDNDAQMLADALMRYAGIPSDQVILLATNQPEERQPTRVNILRRLSNLMSVVPKDGLLIVSFAGHGMERSGQAYLLPTDAQLSDDISLLEETAISVTRIKDRIRATGVGQVVVVLDACRNDPGGRADAPNPLSVAYTRAFNFDVRNHEVQAFATLYATAVGQRAYEYTERKQGYFTWALVEGLKGGAANEKGEVTLAALLRFIQETVPKRIGIDLGGGKQQKPFAVIEGYRAEDLIIAITSPRAGMPEAAFTPTTAEPSASEMSFWDSIKNSSDPSEYQAYLDKFPNGMFVALAKNRLSAIPRAPGETRPSIKLDSRDPISGEWEFNMQAFRTKDGTLLPTNPDTTIVKLKLDGNRVTGEGSGITLKDGSFENNELVFVYDDPRLKAPIKATAHLMGSNKLAGESVVVPSYGKNLKLAYGKQTYKLQDLIVIWEGVRKTSSPGELAAPADVPSVTLTWLDGIWEG